MKYVPFAILGIMGLYSHVSGYPVGFWVAGLVASIWGALLAEQYAEK